MALEARQIINEQMPERIRQSVNGDTGERWYKIDGVYVLEETANPDQPVLGLPQIGEPWSENRSDLLVTEVECNWWTHDKEAASGERVAGCVKARVNYGTDEATGGGTILPPPKPKDDTTKWTSYTTSLRSQQILYGYVPGGALNPRPINNGKGMNIEVGTVNIEVVVHYKEDHKLNLAPMLALANPPAVNDKKVTLPALWGGKIKLVFEPGQLLYKGHQAEMVDAEDGKRVLQVRHLMEAADTFIYEWQLEDAAGKATNQIVRVNPYQADSFDGLW